MQGFRVCRRDRIVVTALSCSVGVSSSFSTMQAGDLVDAGAGFRRQAGHLRLEAAQLRLPDALEPLPQADDRRDDLARLQPLREARHFLVDDGFGARQLAAAAGEVLADDRLQIVHVVEEHLAEIGDRRLDVARQRDVDDEERPMPPRPHRLLDRGAGQDRFGGAGGGDDDVGRRQRRGHLVPRDGAAAELPRQGVGRFQRAAAIVMCFTPCACRWTPVSSAISPAPRMSTFSRREVAEDLARQFDRRIADRDRALAEAGFGAHPLADGERRVEQAMGHGAGELQVARRRVGALHLAENLRLADDQRVEAAGDAKEVARRVVAAVDVEMLGEPAGLDAVILAEEARDRVADASLSLRL